MGKSTSIAEVWVRGFFSLGHSQIVVVYHKKVGLLHGGVKWLHGALNRLFAKYIQKATRLTE